MKKLLYLLFIPILFSCSKEDDCNCEPREETEVRKAKTVRR